MASSIRPAFTVAITALAVVACASEQSGKPEFKRADSRELPSYLVPNIPVAAEAYWAPDSRHLTAQTKDPDAVPSARGGDGNLTYIFTDDGG